MSTPQDAKLMESLSLLVIEDSSFVRKVIKTALASFHVRQIIEAEDAVAGLEILWNMGDNIDVILLDREMPVLDGIEFAKLVRRDKGLPNMNIPIVMISGHVDRAKVLEA
ncbi:MAG: response regulator, partial [Rhodospirillaceae bacterium]|nr:response regulator [Rhodospirillaceae bacterium]